MADGSASDWLGPKEQMLRDLQRHGIRDAGVLAAMRAVPRHRFIPDSHRGSGVYGDYPSTIGHGQTISQPFIVAHMALRLSITPGMRVLEVGTGCGYQAAVLAEMGARVFSIERIPELSAFARAALDACGYGSVRLKLGDGYLGWAEEAPFDGILAACAPPSVPDALLDQLADGGLMTLPVGSDVQRLLLIRRRGDAIEQNDDLWVRFVPMVRGLPPQRKGDTDRLL